MHSFHYLDGRLYGAEVDLTRVAEEFGTPTYVYSVETILDHYTRLDAALAPLDHLICYAVKANSNRAILNLLVRAGAGFDIVSGGELFRVLAAGGDPARCTFAGVGKSDDEIEYALEQGVYSFNVESEAELEAIEGIARAKKKRAPIALRVNPDVDPHTHQYISTGSQENKFGIALDQVRSVYERAATMSHIEIVGVQMHIGSQITEPKPFARAIEKVTPLVRDLKSKYTIKFFSIGGGMGIIYRRALESGSGKWWRDYGAACAGSAFSVGDYADAIVPPLRDLGVRTLVEPGRFLVGNAGVLLTRVRYLKQTGSKKFAIVDAGMNDLIRPALYQSYHEIVPVNEPSTLTPTLSLEGRGGGEAPDEGEFVGESKIEKIDIVGPVCESGDFFAVNREMPELYEGDLLAIMSAGAYGFVMASNYNSRSLPAEVLVRSDRVALIRKRQTWEDLVRGEAE